MFNVVLTAVLLLASAALAQDRHFPAALGSPLPPLQATVAPRVPPARNHRIPSGPWYWGGYGYGGYIPAYAEPAPVVNNIVFEAPPVVLPPPEPIHSSIQSFKAADSNALPAFYVIALKNGLHYDAAAVWVQGNDLHYLDADDQNHLVPLAEVDRRTTRELNQARNLNLRLPPPAQ
ncbi:MAG: hypothetical protein M3O20_16250 [Acidobacteriota bacterium]|nr:hypothetical protein [Acidobacteriota bacterium]